MEKFPETLYDVAKDLFDGKDEIRKLNMEAETLKVQLISATLERDCVLSRCKTLKRKHDDMQKEYNKMKKQRDNLLEICNHKMKEDETVYEMVQVRKRNNEKIKEYLEKQIK
jgi:hypothetical protein